MKNIKKVVCNQTLKYIVDTSASLIYSNIIFTPIELYTTDFNYQEVFDTRLKMSLIGLFISRPYGIFRDYWSKKIWKLNKNSSQLKRYLSDVSANITYYGGIYTLIGVSTGRDLEEIAMAFGTATLTTAITGRPYGMFIDYCRKRVSKTFEKTK
jgi:hypothetical protein